MHGFGLQSLQQRHLPLQRGIDDLVDNARGLSGIIAGDLLFFDAARERIHQRRFFRRRAAQLGHLLERARQHEIRRDDAERNVVLRGFALLIHHGSESAQPRQIIVGIGFVRDLMLAVEEIGN